MRILGFVNNRLGLQVVEWLRQRNENIVGLVVHPEGRQKYTSEILSVLDLPADRVFNGAQLNQAGVKDSIARIGPEIGLSVMFGYILRPELLDIFPQGVINLHTSYLPFNRGAYPNVWSIIDGTPAGVTLHYIDQGVDTGDIIAQQEVAVLPADTGETLYHRLEESAFQLFRDQWLLIKTGAVKRRTQDRQTGSHHNLKDVERIDEIDLDRDYKARDLINVIRSRTFPPYKGAYFKVNGKRVFLQLDLESEE